MTPTARNLSLCAGLSLLVALGLFVARSPSRSGARRVDADAGSPRTDVTSPVGLEAPASARAAESRPEPLAPRAASPRVDEDDEDAHRPGPAVLRVAGEVTDEGGEPIEGAELFVTDREGLVGLLVARSDARGLLLGSVERAPNGLRFFVLADHFRAACLDLVNLGSLELQLGTFRLVPGSELTGRVLDAAGEPIAGAAVEWRPASAMDELRDELRGSEPIRDVPEPLDSLGYGGAEEEEPVPAVRTGGDGRFRLRGVPLLEGFVLATKAGHAPGWCEPFDSRAAAAREIVLVLGPSPTAASRIEGVVRDPSGAPLYGASVEAKSGRIWRSVRTAADGSFLLDEGWKAPVELRAKDEHARWSPASLPGVAPGTLDVELVLREPEWLEVRLVGSQSKPIPWGLVRLYALRSETGRDGATRIQKPVERFELEAFAPGFRTQTFGPFDPAAVGETLDLALTPGQSLRGRVLCGGRPVPGARVDLCSSFEPGVLHEAMGAASLDQPFLLTSQVELDACDGMTDGSGDFLVTVHEDGWHSLRVEAEGFPTTVFGPYSLSRESSVEGLELKLQHGGSLTGRVRLDPGATAAERLVGVCDGASFVHTASIGDDGSYRIENLAPGPYQVRACKPPIAGVQELWGRPLEADGPVVWDCRVAAGATTRFDLDLTLEGSVVLAGRLVFSGAASFDWTARLDSVPGDPGGDSTLRGQGKLDGEGSFEIALTRPGPYWLRVEGDSCAFERRVDLVPGENHWQYDGGRGRVRIQCADFRGFVRYSWQCGEDHFMAQNHTDCLREGTQWTIDVPCGRGRLERAKTAGPDANWTLVRELELARGEELDVELR